MEPYRRVRFTPVSYWLSNPHKGCCTFQRFAGDPLNEGMTWSEAGPETFDEPGSIPPGTPGRGSLAFCVDGYLPSTVAYCRWFWNSMEKEQGVYDFTVIEKALQLAEDRGQTLTMRLMPFGSKPQPQVPEWYAKSSPMETIKDHSRPVHDAPEYLEHWGNFIRAFAARFDADPRLESIDIAFLGPWGEGAGTCTAETSQAFAALWKEVFTKTHRIALIVPPLLEHGVATGSGWRCDCFGDSAFFGSEWVPRHESWNHMYDCYPQLISTTKGAGTAWQQAPVHLETCWVPMTWQQHNGDLDFIIQQGLKYHATYFMPKSCRLPQDWIKPLQEFCCRMGYRFVLRQAMFKTLVKAGETLEFSAWIENVGVAPMYTDYPLVLRFRQEGGIEHTHVISHPGVCTWLPGDVWIQDVVTLPAGLHPGPCDLSVGLVDPRTGKARVSFAIKEVYPDRWVPLGTITICGK